MRYAIYITRLLLLKIFLGGIDILDTHLNKALDTKHLAQLPLTPGQDIYIYIYIYIDIESREMTLESLNHVFASFEILVISE